MDTNTYNLRKNEVLTIKPCPFCGDKEPIVWALAGVYWVQCDQCNAAISLENELETALNNWNVRAGITESSR